MRATLGLLLIVLIAGAVSVSAARQPPAGQDGFVRADTLPVQEQLPAAPLVMTAYAVAWVAILLYVWSIWQRLGRVEREIADVTRRVEAGARR